MTIFRLETEDGEKYYFFKKKEAEEFHENFYVKELGYDGPYYIFKVNVAGEPD